ncbi:amidohydrolase [Bosea sp. RAF48]|uniref:amidohydrolase family protein n=1 Tax=Bosea sp. RAF48 TaxID=3237480 RepID=UPI003F8EFE4A
MTQPQLWQGPIVDAHQHFWDPERNPHPWLKPDANIPFRYGNYSSIKRRYLPAEYFVDTADHDVRQTVYVETEWDENDPIGETRYAAGLAEKFGVPNAIVAQAWLDRPDVDEVLADQAAFGLVRSVRHKPGGPQRPEDVGAQRTLMSDDRWRQGYALLSRHGLKFDLQTAWWNLGEAIDLARSFQETTIVLNHAGLPSDRSEAGLTGWHAAMTKLAECANVRVKISGIGLAGLPWRVSDNRWIVEEIIAMFGADRAMFASNFPVDSLCAPFDTIYTGFKTIAARYSPAEQAKLFAETACQTYRLPQLGAPSRAATSILPEMSPASGSKSCRR